MIYDDFNFFHCIFFILSLSKAIFKKKVKINKKNLIYDSLTKEILTSY